MYYFFSSIKVTHQTLGFFDVDSTFIQCEQYIIRLRGARFSRSSKKKKKKKFLYFRKQNPRKKFLYIFSKKAVLIFEKTESPEKFVIFQETELSYISGSNFPSQKNKKHSLWKNFLYFGKWSFIALKSLIKLPQEKLDALATIRRY